MTRLLARQPKKAKRRKPIFLVFGRPKLGKTMGALSFPSVYYIDCEGGATEPEYIDKLTASGGLYLGPEDGANDFDTVVEQVRALATQKHDRKTVVFDSFSKLFNTEISVEYDRMAAEGRDMLGTFGAEKKPAVAKTRRIIRWLERLNINGLFICHERVMWKDGKQVGETFDAWDKLEHEFDLILRVFTLGKARVVGSRIAAFPKADIFDWGYKAFAQRYGAEAMEEVAASVPLASAEQVATITALADAVKLDAKIRLKWFEKAGVTAWSEMDSATLQKCIDFIQKLLPETKGA